MTLENNAINKGDGKKKIRFWRGDPRMTHNTAVELHLDKEASVDTE